MRARLAARILDVAPLDPDEARAKLLFTVWLLAELGGTTAPPPGRSSAPRRAAPGELVVPRRVRRKVPVRPPRAC
jgi:hypothetical protein